MEGEVTITVHGAIALTRAELRGLDYIFERHAKAMSIEVEHIRDQGDVGWLFVGLTYPGARGGFGWNSNYAYYIVSPTGRVWESNEERERKAEVRNADYDSAGV